MLLLFSITLMINTYSFAVEKLLFSDGSQNTGQQINSRKTKRAYMVIRRIFSLFFLFYVHLFITSLESSNSTKSEINKNQNDSNGILF